MIGVNNVGNVPNQKPEEAGKCVESLFAQL